MSAKFNPNEGLSNNSLGAATSALGGLNTTQLGQTPINAFTSSDIGAQMSAWQLPANAGAMQLPSGASTSTPVNPKVRADIAQAIDMIQILDRLQAKQSLTPAELRTAANLGPVISRAAQLLGRREEIPGKPAKQGTPLKGNSGVEASILSTAPGLVNQGEEPATKSKTVLAKGTNQAIAEAEHEIATRLGAVGLTIPEVSGGKNSKAMDAQVSEKFASVMQNAGYPVTRNMTVGQVLQAAQGQGPMGTPLPNVSSGLNVSQYLTSLSHMSKAQIYQLQLSLFHGGFYDPSYQDGASKLRPGSLDVGTIEAMRTAILETLQQKASGKNLSLEQVIAGGQGSLGNPNVGGSTSAGAFIPQATTAQTQQPLISAFVSALGRNPSQAELQAFTNTYTQELQAGNKTAVSAENAAQLAAGVNPNSGMVDFNTGIPYISGVPTASAAAMSYAENTNPVEYQAHGIANAFGMLMNLVDRQNVSALNTPGTRPDVTS